MYRSLCVALILYLVPLTLRAETPLEQALARAKDNRKELEKALATVPEEQRKGMAFLVENMPDSDLKSLSSEYLLKNVGLAYQARKEVPWGKDIPEEIFLNDVLPYANLDEKREAWRQEFYDLCMPMVKDCKTPSEAAQKLNLELFDKVKVKYSTERKAANQAPKESMDIGKASCTGLSIILSDACRSVCVPSRLVGTPLWANKRGNHTWVEIWDKDWHFTGACEADKNGLDRGWFVGDAAQAKKDSLEHAIYASSFRKTQQHFPLVWARSNKNVPAENVTDRYAKKEAPKDTTKVLIRVLGANQKRVVETVTVVAKDDPKQKFEGTSRGETADTNDILAFELPPNKEFTVRVGALELVFKTGEANKQQSVDVMLSGK